MCFFKKLSIDENGQLQSELFEEIDQLLSKTNSSNTSPMRSPILTLNSRPILQEQLSIRRNFSSNESEDETESLQITNGRHSSDDDIPLSLIRSTKRSNIPLSSSSRSLRPFAKQLRAVSSVPNLLNFSQKPQIQINSEQSKPSSLSYSRASNSHPTSDPSNDTPSSSSSSSIITPLSFHFRSTPSTPVTQKYPLFLSSPNWSSSQLNSPNIKDDETLTPSLSNGQISDRMKARHLQDLKQIHQEIDQTLKTKRNQSRDLIPNGNDMFVLDQALWSKIKNDYGTELKPNQLNQLNDYYVALYQEIRLSLMRKANEMVIANQNQNQNQYQNQNQHQHQHENQNQN